MSGSEELVKLSFFTNIGKAIAAATTLNETLNQVMKQIGEIFAPANWSLLLRIPSTGELHFAVVIGSGEEELKGRILPKGHGIAGWIVENGEALIIEDVSKDKRFDSSMDELTDFKTESIIGVPLKSGNKVFGVIELINKLDGMPFDIFELSILRTIADFAAIAIEKAYYVRALKRVASIDPLTGLYNRRAFQRYLEREIERSKRSGKNLAIMMIDIDGFKKINDTYGHVAGDEVLKNVGSILQHGLRKADVVCRYGGDEFIVIMPEISEKNAKHAKDRINRQLEEHNDKAKIPISLSIGIHVGSGTDPETILKFVDEDLYDDKARNVERNIANFSENLTEMFDADDSQ